MSGQRNGALAISGLEEFLTALQESDDLIEINEPVSPRLEIGAVLDVLGSKQGPAVVFTDVRGYPGIRVVGNVFGSARRIALALGVSEGDVREAYLIRMRDRFQPVMTVLQAHEYTTVTDGSVNVPQQVPALVHHEADTSPYLTCTIAVARDPATGELSMGLHRVQVRSDRELAICLVTPPLSRFLEEAWHRNEPLEIALVNGIHPAAVIGAVTWCPEGENKLDIAGGLRGSPLGLVQCQTLDLQVPAGFQYLIEGVIEPGHREREGVFGESTGIYVEGAESPVIDVKAITWRNAPIYQALQPWSCEDDALFDLCYGSELLEKLQTAYPFVEDLYVEGGSVCASIVVSVGECSSESLRAVITEALTHNPFVKKIVVVNDDIDIRSHREVEWAIATRFQADRDLVVLTGLPGSPIDPSSGPGSASAKIGIDATFAKDEWSRFRRISVGREVAGRAERLVSAVLASSGRDS